MAVILETGDMASGEQSTAIVVSRQLAAPVEDIFGAWTVPEVLARWWWPARFQTTYAIDLRVGGAYRYTSVELPGMGVLCVEGQFLEIAPPHSLRYKWRWDQPGAMDMLVSVHFARDGGGTLVTITHAGLADPEDQENHVVGWNDCLDRLETLSAMRSLAK